MIETSSFPQSEQATILPEKETAATITCTICAAGYISPDDSQLLLQAQSMTIESVFMSICHFCFRCRRPACPQCWDSVHAICAACVQEAQLSFRNDLAPLQGTLFPAASRAQRAETSQDDQQESLLVCVKPGKFQVTVSHVDFISDARTAEMVQLKPESNEPEETPQRESLSEEHQSSSEQAHPTVQPLLAVRAAERNNASARQNMWNLIFITFDRILTTLAIVALLVIAVLVPSAEHSPLVNNMVRHLLHVDIRAEVAYLLQVAHQIHL